MIAFRRCLIAACLLSMGTGIAAAQSPLAPRIDSIPRLHVRPHAMAIGNRTNHAGVQPVGDVPGYTLYVPPQCVGTRRSPLILLLHGGGGQGAEALTRLRPLADQYGMIVLAGTAATPGRWDVLAGMLHQQTAVDSTTRGYVVTRFPNIDVRTIDRALAAVLRANAIDPDRIGLVGFSDGGSYGLFLGRSNEDIFSRVAALSALIPFAGTGPTHPTTQYLVSGGIAENMVGQTIRLAQLLRQEGHAVTTILGLRGHVDQMADEAFVWRWLRESWTDPAITARRAPPADSDPVLTEIALTQLTAFWTRFQQEPDSILTTARLAHQARIPLMLGPELTSVIAMDIPAIAAQYPSVAADLRAAGLTAHQAMAYRTAVVRVGFTRAAGLTPDGPPLTLLLGRDLPVAPIAPTSVLGQNLAFRRTHATAFQALGDAWMWTTQ